MTAAAEVEDRLDEFRRQAEAFRAFAREMLTDSAFADPHIVAEKIIGELSEDQCRVALRLTLPDLLRTMGGRRNSAAPTPKASAKVTAIRNWYAQVLASRLYTGETWKFLRDCTADDLQGAAAERFKAASKTHAEGERWAALADAVEAAGAATVSDLPAEAVRAVLGGAL